MGGSGETYLMDDQVGESKEVAAQSSRMFNARFFSLEESIEDEFGRWKLVGGERVGSLNASGVCGIGLSRSISSA